MQIELLTCKYISNTKWNTLEYMGGKQTTINNKLILSIWDFVNQLKNIS